MTPEPVVIPEKIYFKIGEVCDLVGVQAHVLRYWETEFPAGATGAPITYLHQGKQYVVLAIGGNQHPGEFVALSLP